MRLLRPAGILITAVAAICLVISAYALVNLDARAPGFAPILQFVVLPILVALVLLVALRLSPGAKTNLAIVIVSLGGAILLAETYLISLERTREELAEEAAIAHGFEPDGRARIEVIRDLEKSGEKAYPHFFPWVGMSERPDGSLVSDMKVHGQAVFPLAGVADVTTVVCNELGPWLIYRSDRYGFNNPPDVWDFEATDIAFVGDSFTLGSCVPRAQHFAGVIRERYPRTVNLGYTAAGPIANYATLIEYAKHVRPRHVLWFFFEGNDMANLAVERRTPILMRYLDTGFQQGLIGLQDELDTLISGYVEIFRASAKTSKEKRELERDYTTVPLVRRVRKALGIGPYLASSLNRGPKLVPDYDLLRRVFEAANREIAGWGGTLHVVYLPAWRRGRDVESVTREYEDTRTQVRAVVEKIGIPFLDVTPAFMSHADWRHLTSYVSRPGGHYSPSGYAVVAEVVLKYFENYPK